jgi:hypothetical protein
VKAKVGSHKPLLSTTSLKIALATWLQIHVLTPSDISPTKGSIARRKPNRFDVKDLGNNWCNLS